MVLKREVCVTMRYILIKDSVSNEEINERIKYIYDVFHIYTYVDRDYSSNGLITIKEFPSNFLNLLVIVGHFPNTIIYLLNNIKTIKEKNILLLTCYTDLFDLKKVSKKYNKTIFVSKSSDEVNYYNGCKYGFNFDITHEEILMYRYKNEEFYNSLNNVFERIDANDG